MGVIILNVSLGGSDMTTDCKKKFRCVLFSKPRQFTYRRVKHSGESSKESTKQS